MKNILHSSIICTITLILLPFFASNIFAQSTLIATTPDSIVQITTILPGTTKPQTLTVSVKDGMATLDDDILLGTIAELQSAQDRGAVVGGTGYRWPGGEIPYVIAPGFTPAYITLIRTAIDYINATTHLLIVPRLAQTDYVQFTPSNVCKSAVGRQQVGAQPIRLADKFAPGVTSYCDFPQIIHEIAHAAGLWHEQTRQDRDNFVTIHWENIIDTAKYNFYKYNTGSDIGPYDFNSRMHYAADAFSKNGQPTIVANGGQAFGNAPEYSVGDIATINTIYPSNNCLTSLSLSQTIPQVVRPMVMEVVSTINSSATILSGNNMIYDGGVAVILSPGFKAVEGCTFKAVIEGCGGVYHRSSDPEVEEWMASAENNQTEQPPTKQSENNSPLPDVNIAPNPFSGSTTITYTLPTAQKVDMQVLSLLGNLVAQPIRQEYQDAGKHEYYFRAENLPTGVYFLVMQTGGQKQTKRLVVSR